MHLELGNIFTLLSQFRLNAAECGRFQLSRTVFRIRLQPHVLDSIICVEYWLF